MTIKQKIEIYGFHGRLRRQAALVLLDAIAAGKRVEDVQLIVTKQGQNVELLEAKNG
jgi:hypothetical protein